MKYTLLLLLLLLLFAPLLIFSQETLYETLDHDGLTREYTIHIPPGYNADTPVPLMFSLHGYTSNNDFNLLYTSLTQGNLVFTISGYFMRELRDFEKRISTDTPEPRAARLAQI